MKSIKYFMWISNQMECVYIFLSAKPINYKIDER